METYMKKVVVFGANGMLGNYIVNYVSQTSYVIPMTRKDIDLTTITIPEELNEYIPHDVDVVVNCAGVIKPRMGNIVNAIQINSIFPHILSNYCDRNDIELIHISTDCVFSGKTGLYDEDSISDPVDKYGLSKSLGEPSDCSVIRTSIIGEEVSNSRSLIEWAKNFIGVTAEGYTNHFWNGVTCLRLAQVIEYMIDEDYFWNGVKHIHTYAPMSKYQLLNIIKDIYSLKFNINPKYVYNTCDRTLKSKYEFNILLKHPDFIDQLKEQKEYGNCTCV